MDGYNFYCRCPFKHSVSLEGSFIGKRIPILLLGKYNGYVLFPISGEEEFEYHLFEPHIEGVESNDNCGECSHSDTKLYPHFSSVCFLLDIDEINDNKITLEVIAEIERLTSKFVKLASLINPDSIKWSLARAEEYVEAIIVAHRHTKLDKKEWTPLVHLCPYGIINSKELTITEFWEIFRNLYKEIPLQYELLADTYQCKVRYEYREAILNCATIIEKTLKEQIGAYLDKENTTSIIKEHILKSADGFNKILEVMKKFGIPSDNCGAIKKGTIDIRNRVIHGGLFPTKEEVEQAIEDAKLIIKQYNVPLFID